MHLNKNSDVVLGPIVLFWSTREQKYGRMYAMSSFHDIQKIDVKLTIYKYGLHLKYK